MNTNIDSLSPPGEYWWAGDLHDRAAEAILAQAGVMTYEALEELSQASFGGIALDDMMRTNVRTALAERRLRQEQLAGQDALPVPYESPETIFAKNIAAPMLYLVYSEPHERGNRHGKTIGRQTRRAQAQLG
jgi:hypothetical protein